MEAKLNNTLNSYEENIELDSQIAEILNKKIFNRKKDKMLLQLYDNAINPLVKSRITYYRKKIRNERYTKYERILCKSTIILFWFFSFNHYGFFILANIFIVISLIILNKRKQN